MRIDKKTMCPFLEELLKYPTFEKIALQQEPDSVKSLVCWSTCPTVLPGSVHPVYFFMAFSGLCAGNDIHIPEVKTQELYDALKKCRTDVISLEVIPFKERPGFGVIRLNDGGLSSTLDVRLLEVSMPYTEDVKHDSYYDIDYTDDGRIFFSSKQGVCTMFTIHTPGSIKEMRYVLSMLKPIPQITKSGNYITGDLEDPCTDLDTTEREEYIRKRLREANMSLMDPPSSKPKEVVESVDMPEMADVDYKEIGARKKSEPKPVKSSKKKEPIEGPMATIPKPADVPIQVELFPESVSEPEPESILHDMHMSSLENVTIDVVTIAEVRDAEKAGEMKQAEETVQMTESKTSQEQEQDTDAKPRIRRSTAEVMETKVNAAITLLTEQGYSVEKKQAAKTEEHSLAGIAKELSNIASSLSSLAEKESKQTVSLDALAKIDLLSVVKQSLQLQ